MPINVHIAMQLHCISIDRTFLFTFESVDVCERSMRNSIHHFQMKTVKRNRNNNEIEQKRMEKLKKSQNATHLQCTIQCKSIQLFCEIWFMAGMWLFSRDRWFCQSTDHQCECEYLTYNRENICRNTKDFFFHQLNQLNFSLHYH